jgi:hypothetical protein
MNLGKSPIAAQEPRWNIGIMEYWNDGLTERKNQICFSAFDTHYSNIPTFHHSMWIARIDRDKKTYELNVVEKLPGY